MSKRILVATHDTWLKSAIEMADNLDSSQKVAKKRNSVIALKFITEVPETSHAKIELADDPGKSWYIFSPHWSPVELIEKSQKPEAPANVPLIRNSSVVINWNDFSDDLSEYFTVGELLNYDKQRIPKDTEIKKRLIILAAELDKIRKEWGSPIRVTSGYRPADINRRVGGVSNSRHISGDAVDIAPVDGSIAAFQKWLDQHWFGALGYGANRGFVHLDMRNGNGWKRGSAKGVRWNY